MVVYGILFGGMHPKIVNVEHCPTIVTVLKTSTLDSTENICIKYLDIVTASL